MNPSGPIINRLATSIIRLSIMSLTLVRLNLKVDQNTYQEFAVLLLHFLCWLEEVIDSIWNLAGENRNLWRCDRGRKKAAKRKSHDKKNLVTQYKSEPHFPPRPIYKWRKYRTILSQTYALRSCHLTTFFFCCMRVLEGRRFATLVMKTMSYCD